MQESLPILKAWSWRSPIGPLTTVPMLLIYALGLAVPENVLQESSIAAIFTRTVNAGFLGISDLADLDRFASSTSFPEVALFTASLHWVFLPIQILMMIALSELGVRRSKWQLWKKTRNGVARVGIADLKLVLIGLPLFFGALVVATMVPGDGSIAGAGLTTSSRLGMSTMFMITFWVTAIFCNGTYAIARAFFEFNVRGR